MRRGGTSLLLMAAALVLVLPACLDSSSRTQRVPPNGECLDVDLVKAGAPGEECVVAEECSSFCCACPSAGEFEAQLCLGNVCADATTTCEDALANAALCE